MDLKFLVNLPEIARNRILFKLTAQDLATFSQCCKLFREYANQDCLWKVHCKIDGLERYEYLDSKPAHQSIPLKSSSNVVSPIFLIPESNTLQALCKWQLVYIKAKHLINNWKNGNYTVASILRGHKGRISAFDCDGEIIVSGSADEKLVKVWSIDELECSYTLKSNLGLISSIKMTKQYFCCGSDDGFIRIYEKANGELKKQLSANSSVQKLFIVNELLVAICSDKTIRVWSTDTFQLMHALREHQEEIECFNHFKMYGITGAWDNKIILWNLKNGRKLLTLDGHLEVINCVKMRYGVIVSGSSDSTVRIWNVTVEEKYAQDNSPHSNVARVNKRLMSNYQDDVPNLNSRIICKANCNDVKICNGHESDVYCLDFNSYYIASSGADSKILVWNFEGDLIRTLNGHLGVVRYLFIDDYKLVSGGDAKKIMIWDYREGKLLNTLFRNPNRLHLMWLDETKIITASPENESCLTMILYW